MRAIAVAVVVAGSLAYAAEASQYAIDYSGNVQAYTGLPVCMFEDGNTDGNPCIWTSPRTGLAYFVSSQEYRR